MSSRGDLEDVRSNTHGVYERQALAFDRDRNRTGGEAVWLDRFTARLPEAATVLDLGCGAGEPIAQTLISQKFSLVGVDYSAAMLALATQRFPGQEWLHGDMRHLNLGRRFDGIVSWDAFFHLTPDEQRATIPVLADHLVVGGPLLLTVGPDAGEVTGLVGGEKVYHASLGPGEYRELLSDQGFSEITFVANDADCGGRSVLLATGTTNQ